MRVLFDGNGLCGAALPGGLWLMTGLHLGEVGLRIELHPAAPALGDGWDEIVEAAFAPVPGLMLSETFIRHDGLASLDPVPHRVRYCATGMDAGRAVGVRDEDDPAVDRYLLQFWPAAPAPDAVLRQTSEIARYWHGHAASLPPPEEVARQATEQRRLMAAANEEPDRAR